MTEPPWVVLVVEDNAADASLLTELLEGMSPAVTPLHCDTGEKALALLRSSAVDPCPRLLIMDLRLPGRSGLEILTALRADPLLRRLPVVILSTSDAPWDVDACYAAGANAYLVKGSDPDELGWKVGLAVQLFCQGACPPSQPGFDRQAGPGGP